MNSLSSFALALVLGLAACVPSYAASEVATCVPDEEVSRILDELRELHDECGRSGECWEKHRAGLESALAERPADVHLHRAYLELHERAVPNDLEVDRPAIEARYRSLAEEHPGDPVYLYLLGRAASDKAVSRDYFERAVTAGPDFSWGHLGLIHTYASVEEHKDLDKAEEHIDRFLELCPTQAGSVLIYQRLVDDEVFWRERLPRLRAALEHADAADVYGSYQRLWSVEFKLTALDQHDRLRGRVKADLERLEALELWDDPAWTANLKTGYELVGDDEGATRVQDEILKRRPCDSVHVAFERWRAQNPAPAPAASGEERSAWNRLRYEATREWSERCPDDFNAAQFYFRAVTALDPVPEAELIESGERVAAAWNEKTGGPGGIFPSPFHQVAEAYLEHGLVDRAPALIEKSLDEMRAKVEAFPAAERGDGELNPLERMSLMSIWDSRRLQAEVHLERGETDAARQLLLELAAELERFRPEEGAPPEAARFFNFRAGQYWRVSAALAEREGRRPDAVAFLLKTHSLGARPEDEPLERARAIWRELGGTDEGWQTFSLGDLQAPAASEWKERGEPLATFALTDLAGRTWTLDELRGKRVFANLWATWCGPCREELPLIEDLHRRLAGDDGVVVVTLNLDQNPGLVAPYVKKSEFSFPVLLASDWVESNGIPSAIPRNWIIDGEGKLVKEQVGFNTSSSAEEWIEDVLGQLAGLSLEGGS